MVQLIITVQVRAGRADDYVAAFSAIAPAVRQEPGCLEYDIYRDSTDPRFDNDKRPDTLFLCEKWESIEALQLHTRQSAVLEGFRQAIKDMKVASSYILLTPAHVGGGQN
jgi:quinol monooxygenase YgiN